MTSEEFEKLFKEYYNYLCNLANKIINDRDASEDIVQDVFSKFWLKRNELYKLDSPRSYLSKSVINFSINYSEKKKTTNKHQSEYEVNDHSIDEEATQNNIVKLRKAVDKLPDKCKVIFNLSRFEGLSNLEIANYLDISVKTVENQMGIAIKKLRESLKNNIKLTMFLLIPHDLTGIIENFSISSFKRYNRAIKVALQAIIISFFSIFLYLAAWIF